MKKLMKATSLTVLLLLSSGCTNVFDNLTAPSKPKINSSIETVNFNSIKSISDLTSIGFEWQKVNDSKVIGYNFYRSNIGKNEKTLKLIKSIDNRFTTHYVDKDLEPNTKYAYQISSRLADGSESPTTDAYIVQTLPRITPVEGAQAISDLPNRVKLLWKPHPDSRIGYYRIEKFNTLVNQWIHLKTINQRLSVEYIDTGLDDGTTHKYRIKAFTFDDVESAPTQPLIAKTRTTTGSTKNLRVSNNIPKKIFLTWEASATPNVVRYDIHRSSYSNLGFKKIDSVDSNVLEYTDKTDDDGRVNYYKIIAVDKDGLESSFNATPAKGMSLPKPAKPILSAKLQGNKAVLNWKAADNRTVAYNIQKRIKVNFFEYKLVKITNVTDTSFVDNDVTSTGEYKYSIQSIDEFGLTSDLTNEITLTNQK